MCKFLLFEFAIYGNFNLVRQQKTIQKKCPKQFLLSTTNRNYIFNYGSMIHMVLNSKQQQQKNLLLY